MAPKILHFTALFSVNLGLHSFRPNVFERINGFVQRAEREEECTEDQQGHCSVALQEHGKICERYIQQHQAGFFEIDILNSCCSFLWSGSISSAFEGNTLQFHYQIRTSMSLFNFRCLRKRGHSRQKGVLSRIADSFVDFLSSLPSADFS